MKQVFRVPFAALALTAASSAPLLAETVTECQDRLIFECAQAMEDSNWAERIALGIVCTARIAGCSTINVNVKAF